MELCVYQGTFNPIHNAHLRVAEYVLKNIAPQGIIFIPAYEPPHKESDIKMTEHRFNMVKIATEYNPKFTVSDIEYKRKGKSYTYLTILDLYDIYNIDNKIKFIIGTDAFLKIESWYESDKLKKLVDFLVFPRENNFDESSIRYLADKGYSFKLIPLAFEDISSTELRANIKRGIFPKNCVPPIVEEYIKKYDLYKNR